MKKRNYFLTTFIAAAMSISSALAQDYNITFAILGSSEKPTSIKVENTTQGTEKTLSGTDVLNLVAKTTGIDELNTNASNVLQVYPNPVGETAMLTFNNPEAGKVAINLVNSAGVQLAKLSNKQPQGELSYTVSGLSTGNYILSVQSGSYRSSCVVISHLDNGGTPQIALNSTQSAPQKQFKTLKEAKVSNETIQMQYKTGDVLKFTATLNAKNAYLADYIATQNDEVEFSFTYTITYNYVGTRNTAANPATYTIQTADITLVVPTDSAGFAFGGWFTDSAFTDTISTPAIVQGSIGDTAFYAKWGMNTYHITYNNVGTKNKAANPASYTIETADITLAVPIDSAGFTFGGWFADAVFADTVSTPAIVEGSTSNIAFYAKWASNPITDSRDGNVYKTVGIGDQVWMAENLAYLPSVNQVADGSEDAAGSYYYVYGYDGTNVTDAKATANYSTYGVLYNWDAAKAACPAGWHLPSDAEWTQLADYLGGTSDAGGKLKETGITHWNSPNTGATNETSFTALPAGYRYADGTFFSIGDYGYWWSATEYLATSAWYRFMYYYNSYVYRDDYNKELGFSVRCVRD